MFLRIAIVLFISFTFAYALTPSKINDVINNTPGVSWVAGDSEIAKRYEGMDRVFFGSDAKPSDRRETLWINGGKRDPSLPWSIDWRNFAGQNWMTPVRDQKRCGSCVAYGTAAAIEGYLNIVSQVSTLNIDLSEQHIFMCGDGDCQWGWKYFEGYQTVMKIGITDEDCFPDTMGINGENVPCNKTCADIEDRLYRLKDYDDYGKPWGNNDINEVKKLILKGPITTQFFVYRDIFSYKSGIYKHVTGEFLGAHVVAIVGYNDKERYFIVKNSWGPKWGDNGYFKISYDDADSEIAMVNYHPIMDKINEVLKVETPSYGKIVSGKAAIKLYSNVKKLSDVKAYVAPHNAPNPTLSVPVDTTMRAKLNTTVLKDGMYTIWAEGKSSSGNLVKSSHTLLQVINK
jgi:hypothetical protein